jgi:ankyrin repeat protein
MAFWNRNREPERKFASLHEAVEAGDYAAVQRFLRDGIDPNAQDGRDATALHIAAARGHLEIAKLLIESGADVDFLIDEGGTPLMAASALLKPTMIDFLISRGAQPNKKGHDGRFPLVCPFHPDLVLVNEQIQCIRSLVAHGATVNDRTDSGATPLMKAAWFGNREAVEELLELGADPTLRDNGGRTAAMLAFERGHDELAQLLKQRADQAGEA